MESGAAKIKGRPAIIGFGLHGAEVCCLVLRRMRNRFFNDIRTRAIALAEPEP